jgi:unsaturated chondroitin disaccharide hydrolase
MMKINHDLKPADLKRKVDHFFEVSARKLRSLAAAQIVPGEAPVHTRGGRYISRPGMAWTDGFLHGSAILQFDASWDEGFLRTARMHVTERMLPEVTNAGSDAHGFSLVSTCGNLWRLHREGRITGGGSDVWEMALRCSGAVQAQRWTFVLTGDGFIHSANGPHSLQAVTMRSLRSPALAHRLGQVLIGENGERIPLLQRLLDHARTTATWAVYQGEGRDAFDVRGRVAEECIFNVSNGRFVCPNSLSGHSPVGTPSRALAHTVLGFAEQLEFLATLRDEELLPFAGRAAVESWMLRAAQAAADFYLANSSGNGIPYWDTSAPNLARLDNWRDYPADPFNEYEPVDSAAASVAAQGLLRLGRFLQKRGSNDAARYWQAGLTILSTLLDDPYLSESDDHQGLILHAVANLRLGWDSASGKNKAPCGESTMEGDYHAREAALHLRRIIEDKSYLAFFGA